MLIAHVRYKMDDVWHTHIDYSAFNAAWRAWRSHHHEPTQAVLERNGDTDRDLNADTHKNTDHGRDTTNDKDTNTHTLTYTHTHTDTETHADLHNDTHTHTHTHPHTNTHAIDVMSYIAPTPSWAIVGSKEAGFDPAEKRMANKARRPRPGGGGGIQSIEVAEQTADSEDVPTNSFKLNA